MNKHIIAIGGGGDTSAIDQHIVMLSGKQAPKVLFVPTASSDDQRYIDYMKKIYQTDLMCQFETLLLIKEKPSKKEITEKIANADIIYIGGGNTLKMMRLWRHLGIDILLKDAYNKGTVMCGLSAGSICWFDYGHSDSMYYYHPENWNYIRVRGLGLIKGFTCPHFDSETNGKKRKDSFLELFKKHGGTGITIEDCTAIHFQNDKFRVINSTKGAKAYKIKKRRGKIEITDLEAGDKYQNTSTLYT
jgi:dipeptidase E